MSETISKTNITIIIILLLILILATYLRVSNLPTNPAWYTDEGTHLSIAHHLLHGRVQYFAVTDSMLLFARPPLFHACLAVVSGIFGEGIATLRGFTAGLGVFSTLLVFIVVRLAMRHGRIYASLIRPYDAKNHNEAQQQYNPPATQPAHQSPLSIKWGGDLGVGFALWATFLYAVYPQAILYTRFGFSYALLTPMVILIAYFLMRHLQTGRWNPLAWAGILAGIGLLGDIMMGSIIGVVGLIALFKSPKMLIWLIPLMALPFGIYAGINLLNHPSAFLFDLNFTLNRLGGIPITRQLNTIAENFTMLLSTDLWFPLGIAGLFLVRPLALRVVSACLVLLPIVIIGRTVAMFHLSLYYMSPLFPLIILGVASITWRGGVWIIQHLQMMFREMRFVQYLPVSVNLFFAGIITVSLIGAPLFFILQHTTNGINTRIQTAIDPFLVDSADGEAVIRFFQSQPTEDTLILASPSIGWALEIYTSANVADWQMHVAYIGYDAIHLPHNVPAERYAFIPTLDHADYVVIDAIWRNWGNVHVPQAVVLYHTVVTEWELVYQAGTLEVYARPN